MNSSSFLNDLRTATETLESAGTPRPRWTAEQLLSRRLGCEPVELYLEPPAPGPAQSVQFFGDVAARASGIPLQYLLGTAAFYGREFSVGPGVFVPRPETELLVDTALELLKGRESSDPCVLDVGTGSGAIAVTLALERSGLRISALDVSVYALSFARRNAKRHGCRIPFVRQDLLQRAAPRSADMIIANLPYLDPEQAVCWPIELHWEPWLAVDGGEQGVAGIQGLVGQALPVLRPGGRLLLEIGGGQAGGLRDFAPRNGFEMERIVPDLAGIDRVAVLKMSADGS